jgi:hypothetical protein
MSLQMKRLTQDDDAISTDIIELLQVNFFPEALHDFTPAGFSEATQVIRFFEVAIEQHVSIDQSKDNLIGKDWLKNFSKVKGQ